MSSITVPFAQPVTDASMSSAPALIPQPDELNSTGGSFELKADAAIVYADFLARIEEPEHRFDAAGVNFHNAGKSVAENLSGERCEKES